jgi:hypothetical protein
MTRADALTYLAEQWPGLQAALGVTSTDDAAGFKGAIDAALRALGVPTAELAAPTIATADEGKLLALLDYYGARRLHAEAAVKVDVSVGDVGVSKRYSQMRDGLNELLAGYLASLDMYGVGPVRQMASGRFGLDFLEPAAAEWGR